LPAAFDHHVQHQFLPVYVIAVAPPPPPVVLPRQGGGERYDAPRWSRARKKGSIVMCKGGGSSSTIDPAIKNLLTQNVASARAVANVRTSPILGRSPLI